MKIKSILLGILLGFILFVIFNFIKSNYYNYYSNKKINILDLDNQCNNNFKNLKHRKFNDEYASYKSNGMKRYSSNADTIIDENLDKMMDDLLENKQLNVKKSDNDLIIDSEDKNKMFDELENEINKKYNEINVNQNGYFDDVTVPSMSNLIPNTNDVKNSDINPVINPNVYKDILDGEGTIWEQYDKATTNNNIQNLDNTHPREISDAFKLDGDNKNYGSRFDNF
jgi:hypothetical protein